ncbi:hypothetical protein ACXWO0_09350, partial [Streptococcus pyogenes]
TIKDVTEDLAREVRDVWKKGGPRAWRREKIDTLISTCGVEYLGYHKRSGQHVHYCNAGDAYAGTILFIGDRLVVGCWGDMVEKNLITERH